MYYLLPRGLDPGWIHLSLKRVLPRLRVCVLCLPLSSSPGREHPALADRKIVSRTPM